MADEDFAIDAIVKFKNGRIARAAILVVRALLYRMPK
jgi:hypothetical protein